MTRVWSSFPSQFKSGKALSSLDPWKAVTVTPAAQVMRVIFFNMTGKPCTGLGSI